MFNPIAIVFPPVYALKPFLPCLHVARRKVAAIMQQSAVCRFEASCPRRMASAWEPLAGDFALHLHETAAAEGGSLLGALRGGLRHGAEVGEELAPRLGEVDERLERGVEGLGVERWER